MKKSGIAKALGAMAVSAALALGCAGTALAGGGSWQRSGSDWWYAYDGGGYAASGWERVGGEWYLFDGAGWMETGWQQVGGTWYYLEPSGAMAEGWAHDGSAWYYLQPGSGAMATGWKLVGGIWYYLTGSGAMAEGWQSVGGQWYYLEPGSGAMATGWKSLGGTWYLLSGSGAMLTGWQYVGGDWYWMDASGAMAHDCWVGDYWLTSSGAMATSAWVDGGRYYVDASGAWAPGARPGDPGVPEKPSAHEHSWQPVYEQRWVEDEPAWDEEVWEQRTVCRCGYVPVGETNEERHEDLNRHTTEFIGTPDEDERFKTCSGTKTMQLLVSTIHHDATGHYEQVKTGEKCACGATR